MPLQRRAGTRPAPTKTDTKTGGLGSPLRPDKPAPTKAPNPRPLPDAGRGEKPLPTLKCRLPKIGRRTGGHGGLPLRRPTAKTGNHGELPLRMQNKRMGRHTGLPLQKTAKKTQGFDVSNPYAPIGRFVNRPCKDRQNRGG
jgi:hypothetical protein